MTKRHRPITSALIFTLAWILASARASSASIAARRAAADAEALRGQRHRRRLPAEHLAVAADGHDDVAEVAAAAAGRRLRPCELQHGLVVRVPRHDTLAP